VTARHGDRPGDRPGISLATEPFGFLHAATAGDAAPGPVQPPGAPPALEEEPAQWPEV
jgi:hypothetical protein